MRSEPTLINAILHRDPAYRTRFPLHETWADPQDLFHVQMRRLYGLVFGARPPELLAAPRKVSVGEALTRISGRTRPCNGRDVTTSALGDHSGPRSRGLGARFPPAEGACQRTPVVTVTMTRRTASDVATASPHQSQLLFDQLLD
jgi:hypothetical protein